MIPEYCEHCGETEFKLIQVNYTSALYRCKYCGAHVKVPALVPSHTEEGILQAA